MKDHWLFLDTSGGERMRLALVRGKTVYERTCPAKRAVSERLLPEVLKLLSRRRLRFNNIKRVVVVVGPGSFSGVRTGVTTANALAFALNVPIIGLRAGEAPDDLRKLRFFPVPGGLARPFYGWPPHITKPKDSLGRNNSPAT